jgi:digeranylgeranylglycerophospholipid reductase
MLDKASEPLTFDIIIVGGGPAGAAIAYYLRHYDQQGLLKVLLIEKKGVNSEYEKYHHKCGEGVSRKFLDFILPIRLKEEEIVSRVNHVKEYWGTEEECLSSTEEYILNRPLFLKNILTIAEALGVILRFDEVIKLEDNATEAKITCVSGFRAIGRLIIGADGPNSRIRATCGFEKPKILTAMQYLVPADANDKANEIIIWYDEKYRGGYKYSFPYGQDKRKLGFIHSTETYEGPVLEIQAKQIAMGGLKNYVRNHVVLIGDAAGQTNLMTGGGIFPAFVAARKLSIFIAHAIKNTNAGPRTAMLVNAAKKFEAWWIRSPYENRHFIGSYERFARFSNKDLYKFSAPLRCKNSLKHAIIFLRNISYCGLYFKLFNAAKYS